MKLLLALVAALALVSCSPEPETYGDVNAVAAALEEADLSCVEVSTSPPGDIVRDQGTCKAAGSEHDIFVFADEDARDRWLEIGGGLGEVVVGPNWVVIPDGESGPVAEALAGEIR